MAIVRRVNTRFPKLRDKGDRDKSDGYIENAFS